MRLLILMVGRALAPVVFVYNGSLIGAQRRQQAAALRSVQQGIAERSNEIFPYGKYEIYLAIGEILRCKVKFASRVDVSQCD